MSISENFANNIKRLRKERGETQEQLAEKAKISRSYLGDLENQRKNITVDTLEKIADALDVPPLYLLSDSSRESLSKDTFKELIRILNERHGHNLSNDVLEDLFKGDYEFYMSEEFMDHVNQSEDKDFYSHVMANISLTLWDFQKEKRDKTTELDISEFSDFRKQFMLSAKKLLEVFEEDNDLEDKTLLELYSIINNLVLVKKVSLERNKEDIDKIKEISKRLNNLFSDIDLKKTIMSLYNDYIDKVE